MSNLADLADLVIEEKLLSQYMNNKSIYSIGKLFEVKNNIALIRIYGAIAPYPSWFSSASVNLLFEIMNVVKNDKNIKGMAFIIDSPGGAVYRVTELFNAIKDIKIKKVAFVDNCCCSLAYWLASACNKIIATSETAYFGSIGVLTSRYYGNDTNDTVVITNRESINKHLDLREDKAKEYTQNRLDEIYSMFTRDILSNRSVKKEAMDGSYFLSNKAKELGLIDEIDLNCDIESYFNNEITIKDINEAIQKAMSI